MDDIKLDLGKIGWGRMDWIGVAQDRDQRRALVNAVLIHWVPSSAGKYLEWLHNCWPLENSAQLQRVSFFFSYDQLTMFELHVKYILYWPI